MRFIAPIKDSLSKSADNIKPNLSVTNLVTKNLSPPTSSVSKCQSVD